MPAKRRGNRFDSVGWRALRWFWLLIGIGLAAGAGGLAWLGPPEVAPVAEQPGEAPDPTAPAAPEGGRPGAAPPSPPQPPARAATAPPTLPPAPEPPPLAAATTRAAAQPDRPIAAPDPALLERAGPDGSLMLPRVGPDGRTSIRTYARAFDRADQRPRVAVVLAGIGLSGIQTGEAIRRLPGAIGLALNPYGDRLDAVAERARERGMETLIALPMEPNRYPLDDPGPQALLTSLPLAENLGRLDWALGRAAGYVGVLGGLGAMRGERFAQSAELFGTVQDILRSRGLLYIDPRPGMPAPARAWGRTVDVVLDEPATRGEIERRLGELERLARERGSALGLAADPAPVLIDRLAAWAAGLEERGLVLAPVTALIRRPEAAGSGTTAAEADTPTRR